MSTSTYQNSDELPPAHVDIRASGRVLGIDVDVRSVEHEQARVQLKREEVGCLGAVIVIRQTSSLGTTPNSVSQRARRTKRNHHVRAYPIMSRGGLMQISAVPAPLTPARVGLELEGRNRLSLHLHIERRVCFVCHGEVRELQSQASRRWGSRTWRALKATVEINLHPADSHVGRKLWAPTNHVVSEDERTEGDEEAYGVGEGLGAAAPVTPSLARV